jgi:hypothetical protein
MDGNLTMSLFKRGDSLAVSLGQLFIMPNSGQPVPLDWLATNRTKIMSEIAHQSNQSIFSYSYYQTGIYNSGRSPGVMMKFSDLLTGEEAYAVFNATLKYQRKTKSKKAGDSLPDRHFHIRERAAFYSFWMKTGLDIPRRFSEWHKSMSKLQHVYFVAEKRSGDKLANNSIQPLSLSNAVIQQLFSDNTATSERQASDNTATRNGDKEWRQGLVTSNGDKDIAADQISNGLTPDPKCVSNEVRVFESARDLSACASNRVLSNQVMTCNVVPLTSNSKVPEEQSIEEWFQDYDSAG